MSLHALSQNVALDLSEEATSSDSGSELRRQIQFMGEKETIMIARLADLHKEKVGTEQILLIRIIIELSNKFSIKQILVQNVVCRKFGWWNFHQHCQSILTEKSEIHARKFV